MEGFPHGDLGLTAPDVLVERDVETLDQVGAIALDKPGHVLCEMLAGFGDEVADPLQHLVAHAVPGGHPSLVDDLADARVKVLDAVFGLPLEAQVEGHVVDARGQEVYLFDRHADIVRQLPGGALDAVTETDSLDLAGPVGGPAVDRHGVDVIQERGVGAQALPCRGTRRATRGSCAARA